MQTRGKQKHKQRGRFSGIAMFASCAVAILLAGALSSIGETTVTPSTVTVLALPNKVDDNRAGEPEDVATLLAWHVEARILAQYPYEITLAEPSRTLTYAERPFVVPVAAQLRDADARY